MSFLVGLSSNSSAIASEACFRASFNLSALVGLPPFFFSVGAVGVSSTVFLGG